MPRPPSSLQSLGLLLLLVVGLGLLVFRGRTSSSSPPPSPSPTPDRPADSPARPRGTLMFSKDIAPLNYRHCTEFWLQVVPHDAAALTLLAAAQRAQDTRETVAYFEQKLAANLRVGWASANAGAQQDRGRIRSRYRSRPRLRVAGRPRPSNRYGRRDAARTRRRGRLRYQGSARMLPPFANRTEPPSPHPQPALRCAPP